MKSRGPHSFSFYSGTSISMEISPAPPPAYRRRVSPVAVMMRFFVFGIIALSACAKRESAVEAGLRTQTLHIGNAFEPRYLDPHVVTALADFKIVTTLIEGLTSSDPIDGHPIPGVAETWKTSPDGAQPVVAVHL